jgi:hypothetical protein
MEPELLIQAVSSASSVAAVPVVPVITEPVKEVLDAAILAQAVGYGTAFTFGFFQTVLKKYIPTDWKALSFVVICAVAVSFLYYGLLSGSVLLQVIIAAISAGYAVTGGVDFYKKDMQTAGAL